MTAGESMGDFMREEEERLLAAARDPARIAADAAQMERNRERMARELESLERQGMVVRPGEEEEEEEEEEEL